MADLRTAIYEMNVIYSPPRIDLLVQQPIYMYVSIDGARFSPLLQEMPSKFILKRQ